MVFHTIEDITKAALHMESPARVVVAGAALGHVIEALKDAEEKGVIVPTLVGKESDVRTMTASYAWDVPDERYLDVPSGDPADICAEACRLIREEQGDFLMKGNVNTAQILKAILNKETGLPHEKLVTQFSFAFIPGYHKLVVLNDPAITPHPTLEQKAQAIRMISKTLRDIGYDETIRVAALCAAETISPKIPESTDAAALANMSAEGAFPGCVVEGPIQLDTALLREVAQEKGAHSNISGETDVLLFPDMAAGNLTSKMLTVFGGGMSVGMAIGAGVPIAITSRVSTSEAKFAAICLAAVAAMGRKKMSV